MVKVSCKNKETYFADHVIVCVPLGYLKKNHATLFSPPLPEPKIQAIKEFGFGKVDKIFLQFDQPFWKVGDGGIKFCWPDNEAVPKSPNEWYKKIFAFDQVLNNSNVLFCFISGAEAAYMETLSDEEVAETCTALLRRFTANPSIPAPSKVLRSSWITNPYTLGSYSYPSVKSPRGMDVLAQPLMCNQVPAVLFAGEATHEKFSSTMHGARGSGLREATQLINHYAKIPASKLWGVLTYIPLT